MGPFRSGVVVPLLSAVQTDLLIGVALIILVALAMLWLLVRHQLLLKRRGVFVCGFRTLGAQESGEQKAGRWMLGLAQYAAGNFEWYRPINPLILPSVVLPRSALEMVEHHRPTPADRIPFLLSHEVVTLTSTVTGKWSRCQIVIDQGVLTGLMSWLEAAPPGGASYLSAHGV